jgi:hypothetical protein
LRLRADLSGYTNKEKIHVFEIDKVESKYFLSAEQLVRLSPQAWLGHNLDPDTIGIIK